MDTVQKNVMLHIDHLRKKMNERDLDFESEFIPVVKYIMSLDAKAFPADKMEKISQTEAFQWWKQKTSPSNKTTGPKTFFLPDATEEVERHYRQKALRKQQNAPVSGITIASQTAEPAPAAQQELPPEQAQETNTEQPVNRTKFLDIRNKKHQQNVQEEPREGAAEPSLMQDQSYIPTRSQDAPPPLETVSEDQQQPTVNQEEAQDIRSPQELRAARLRRKRKSTKGSPSTEPVATALQEIQTKWPQLNALCSDQTSKATLEEKVIQRIDTTIQLIKDKLPTKEEEKWSWFETNIFPLLDNLANFYSKCCELYQQGDIKVKQLMEWLKETLYQSLSKACQQAAWFSLEEIVPFQTDFNQEVHRTKDLKDFGSSFANKIIAIESVGLYSADPQQKTHKRTASVDVGI